MNSNSDFSTIYSLATIIFLSWLVVFSAEARIAKCPENSTISPCICVAHRKESLYRAIHCFGPLVTQDAVSTAMSALLEANNGSADYPALLGSFSIQNTRLQELDLLPLTNLFAWILDISNNPNLTSLTFSGFGSETNATDQKCIQIPTLRLKNNSLTDSGLQHAFHPFCKTDLTEVTLSNNLLTGSPQDGEKFLQGLSAFERLRYLNLTANKIERLAGGPFKGIKNLRLLVLSGNPLNEVGQGALDLYEEPNTYAPSRTIYLVGCGLNDSKFGGETGIERNQNSSGIRLILWENEFETVDEDKFCPFLEAHPNNEVEFDRRPKIGPRLLREDGKYSYEEGNEHKKNPIVCDEKLKWLKSKERFFHQINNQACKNDPGNTIFNTKSV